MDRTEPHNDLHLALSSWVLALHAAGVRADRADVVTACEQVLADETEPQTLIDAVCADLPDSAGPDAVRILATDLFGDALTSQFSEGSRSERASRIRAYQFGRQLPWLARIIERHDDGTVGPAWLLIEHVTDRVCTLDPNPWNDIEEARSMPVSDFQVLWELDGCTSFAVR